MSALLRPAAVGGLALGLAAAGLAGLPGLDVGAVAAAGWIAGGGAGAALARRRRDALPAGAPTSASAERPNPYAVPQPWRDLVADVLRAQQKFAETAAAGAPGPLQSRLLSLASRLDDGVRESWLVALRGAALNEAITRLDPGEIRRRLAIVEAQPDGEGRAETLAALRAQIASVQRIERLAEETRGRLQLLAARLGEAVSEAVLLTVAPDPTGLLGLDGVAAGIEQVVGELHALRAVLVDAADATG